MQRHVTRLVILGLLLLSGAASGFAIWTIERSARQRDEQRETKEATVERLLSSIAAISSAQQAYADYSRRDVASFAHVSLQVDRLTTEAAGLRAAAHSRVSSERLEEFWTALSSLMGAETRAREQFAGGDESAAADTILASARAHVTTLNTTLRAFREAEAVEYGRARNAASWQLWTVLGVSAALWAIGLAAFAVKPLRQVEREIVEPSAVSAAIDPPLTLPAPAPEPSIDLGAVARLSTELSRLSDQASLEALLARAAEVFDARGIIVWMRAGEELVAAAAHGYEDSVLRRIPSIPRTAGNATAAAWRTGETGTVPEDSSGYGAIVAPMLNPSGCVGVLAAEVRGGRERDAATCAVATILASQLAGVLAPLPGTSTAGLETQSLDRKAAS